MSVRQIALVLALATTGLSTAVLAQQAPVSAPTAQAGTETAMPQDCAKPMARHDHGAEKGTPTPMWAKCAMATPAAPTKTPVKMGHDHAKFHKLM
jgi:hypothetical protein